ncbi:hypothetical protein PF010_g28858 [Phytophthora fragariae]|uniref:Uncharacterized protein n=2 Tax=Phytophthora fragariae TaxID=53985 RepID=A0A6A4B4F8_9STRA|nr:hypothetical protein PF003_g8466 [Phytophthora fragariae]KAE8963829.1 hypothetical protein PF011_g28894 [Phytophthora fragariae]KAE9063786.1 hypothetical protein PF010_g28858 [Phytophthora fragariae]KAE9069734.1 hypothetical protein PF006_g29508 [Phytophthora fragariae]KAE9102155.1 hypothetical protein PF007_g14861 [Phytophthora fragariae]
MLELAQEPVVQEPTEEMAQELAQKLGAEDFVLELGGEDDAGGDAGAGEMPKAAQIVSIGIPCSCPFSPSVKRASAMRPVISFSSFDENRRRRSWRYRI